MNNVFTAYVMLVVGLGVAIIVSVAEFLHFFIKTQDQETKGKRTLSNSAVQYLTQMFRTQDN